ncbi:hypothetical protein E2C01_069425 [Portunus trituberculatus]|uniref:Uncharacterized protein n=1 Tax=Portunus trituberculatus TaxID=210409 RepID=A0A5B7HQ11_PORTR|nr:hypothetical protein [Portunus trituberculatus]
MTKNVPHSFLLVPLEHSSIHPPHRCLPRPTVRVQQAGSSSSSSSSNVLLLRTNTKVNDSSPEVRKS